MNKKTIGAVIALYLTSFAIMSDNVIIPAANELFLAFPGENPLLYNFVLSGPALLIVVSSLLSNLLISRYSKKKILLVSTLVFCISAGGGRW